MTGAVFPTVKTSLELGENERWYLVQTLSKGEFRAQFHLHAQGFRTYLALYQKTTRHARQVRTVRAPLFPRYLFVVLDLARDRWLSIQGTFGVSSLIRCDDRPAPVPVGAVESLIERADEANLTQLDDGLRLGQQVRILSGSFADSVGTLVRLDDNERVRVLLKMMGSEVPVSIDRARLSRSS
jgi:transcription elongation factor/antiterminator RfaH